MKDVLLRKRSGAVAFEYVIILVVMAAMIFAAFGLLSGIVMDKAEEIGDCIMGNGVGC